MIKFKYYSVFGAEDQQFHHHIKPYTYLPGC